MHITLEPRYMQPEDVAQALRLNINTVYRALRACDIPHMRLGNEYRIPIEWLYPGYVPKKVYIPVDRYTPWIQEELPLRWR